MTEEEWPTCTDPEPMTHLDAEQRHPQGTPEIHSAAIAFQLAQLAEAVLADSWDAAELAQYLGRNGNSARLANIHRHATCRVDLSGPRLRPSADPCRRFGRRRVQQRRHPEPLPRRRRTCPRLLGGRFATTGEIVRTTSASPVAAARGVYGRPPGAAATGLARGKGRAPTPKSQFHASRHSCGVSSFSNGCPSR
jgi:hypothetical protein